MGFVADFIVGSKEASNTKDASEANLALQTRIYDESVAREEPFRQSSLDSLSARDDVLNGGGGEAFRNSQFFQAPFNEGQDAIEGGAAARGGLLTGQTAKDVINYGQQQGGNNFLNYFNAINGAAGAGQVSNQNLNNAGQNFANGATAANNQYLAGQNRGLQAIGDGIDGAQDTLQQIFGGF